ncbi:unnamed protein product [Paramecium primaurelia]|uniref:Uncharacterized protein n=1 Tax=Paramecium primaurelia TaxID=5886 RepID=A0A8S1MRM0_PARPR|nr:unnamed protein product [Paramecium primaurelia]
MNYLVLPLINVPFRPQNPKHQPILLDGLKRLSQFDQLEHCKTEITFRYLLEWLREGFCQNLNNLI